METGKKRRYYYNNISPVAVDGSGARKLEFIPNTTEENELSPKREREIKRKPKVYAGIDLFAFVLITFAIGFTFYTCINYLDTQSLYTQMNKNITHAENELTKLKNENNAALSKINTSLDLSYVYEVATNELGMIAPNNNQVITYKRTLSNYVRQYEDIPEIYDNSIFDLLSE